jgi:hypothetical protein
MKAALTRDQIQALKQCLIGGGGWIDERNVTTADIARRLAKRALIDRDVARGAMYGITHHTRIRITPAGRLALRRYWP